MTSHCQSRRDSPAFSKGEIGVLGVNRKDEEPPPAGQGFELGALAECCGLELLLLETVVSWGVVNG